MGPVRRRLTTLVLFAAAASITGCAGSHPQPDHQVLIFAPGDRTAVVSVGTPGDDRAGARSVADALGFGTTAAITPSDPDLRIEGTSVSLTGVDDTSLVVPISTVRAALTASGSPDDAELFVSVCTSALSGRASGSDIELAHLDSCATWSSTRARDAEQAIAVITFEPRDSPARTSAVFLALLALAGLTMAVLSFTARSPRRGGLAYLATWVLVVVAGGISAVGWMFAYRLARPWAETGQVFDVELAGSARALALAALIAGVVLPAGVALAGRRVTRRRWRG